VGRARRQLVAAAGFVLVAVVLTWPIAVTLDRPSSVGPDYFSNLWNAWWMRTALFERCVSPYWTDYLHYPLGISLGRHTLSPVNAVVTGLLSYGFGLHAAYNLMVIGHFALGGWAAFALARYLTASVPGSVLAGLIYSFCPIHYFYIGQINALSIGILPLAILSLLKVYREGGAGNVALAAVAAGVLTAASYYYAAFAALFGALLAVGGRLFDPRVPLAVGLQRLFLAGACAAVAAVAVAWPLLAETLAIDARFVAGGSVGRRANDLLGYVWVDPPARVVVSWPTMLGYSSLLLVVLGGREVLRQRFWLFVGGVFLLLSLGGSLSIHDEDTGIPLPFRVFESLPVLSMLRKADRLMVLIQLVVGLLAAFAWRRLAGRIHPRALRGAAWTLCAVLLAVELSGVPFQRFEYPVSPYFEGVASAKDISALIHIPPNPSTALEGRYDYAQTIHRKRMPQGYTTNLALTEPHVEQARSWMEALRALWDGDGTVLVRRMRSEAVEIAVVHKTVPGSRPPMFQRETVVWAPFFRVRRELVAPRQTGPLIDRTLSTALIEIQRRALTKELGPPIFEDDLILVFRLGPET
jgi:hypothetical protein